jgi:hypothetical protein
MAFYEYHPASTARLGYAYDPRRPYEDKTTGGYIEWTNTEQEGEEDELEVQTGASQSFKISEVTNRKQLYEAMSLDVNIEAKYNLFSAKASLKFESEFTFDEKTLVYVATGKKVYLPQTKNGVLELSKKGERVWKKINSIAKLLNFQRAVGTEVVTRVQRGSFVSVVYIFKCSSASYKQKIKSALNVGWSTGSASVNFSTQIQSIDESMSIITEGFQSGVSTNQVDPRISEIIDASPGDIIAVRSKFKEILSNISIRDRDSSPIISFNTTSISDTETIFDSQYKDDFDRLISLDPVVDSAVQALSVKFLLNENRLSTAQKFLDQWNPLDFIIGSKKLIEDNILELQKVKSAILKFNSKLILASDDSIFTSMQIPNVSPLTYSDILISPLTLPLTWKSRTTADQQAPQQGIFTTYMWPMIYVKFPEIIKFIIVWYNNQRLKVISRNDINMIIQEQGSFEKAWGIMERDFNIYIWGWHQNLVTAEIANRNSIHNLRQKGKMFSLEVVFDDGSHETVQIGNPSEPIPISKKIFQNFFEIMETEGKVERSTETVALRESLLRHIENNPCWILTD